MLQPRSEVQLAELPLVSDIHEFTATMADTGIAKFPAMLGETTLAELRRDTDAVYVRRRAIQERNGVGSGMEGAAHHVLGDGTSLDRLIAELPLWDHIAHYFDGKFILLNFGATLHLPGGSSYVQKAHRDVRVWTQGFRLSLNMLVMLDDFTVENGATLFLPGSQNVPSMPSSTAFNASARHVTGKAGDILLFDSSVVHAAAPNNSPAKRRALTLCFGRPFVKPQMDWPRFLPSGSERQLTPKARQLLGYDARVAASLDEYYQPPERWTFKPDQR